MNLENERPSSEDEKLSRGIGVSFAVHGIILLFFTINAVFFTPEKIDFSQAVRVDIVGLPDKEPPKITAPAAKEEAKPAPTPAAEKPVEKPPEKAPPPPAPAPAKPEAPKLPPKKEEAAINLEKNKSKQQNAMEKLKAMAALDKIKEDVAAEKAKEAAKGKAEEAAQKIRGNVLSPGTALTGLNKAQHETYLADLNNHIKQHWALPEWLAKRDLSAQVRVQFDSRGNILSRKIVKSSGNPSYDEEVLATIDKAAPFLAPPEKFIAVFSVDGVLIGFPE